jgi:hypothetical protein
VPPHRRREHHKRNNNDSELTHSSKIKQKSRQFYEADAADAQEGPMTTVWIYVDTSKEVGDVYHLKVFASADAADESFKDNDPEGVAFEYEVLE